jgi:hypothetical protein
MFARDLQPLLRSKSGVLQPRWRTRPCRVSVYTIANPDLSVDQSAKNSMHKGILC